MATEHKATGGRMTARVVTPTGQTFAGEVEELVAPGELGEFGVLPLHIPLLSALRPGVLTIRQHGEKRYFAVGNGFVQVGGASDVRVLTELAQLGSEVEVAEVTAELDKAQAKLKAAHDDGERKHHQHTIDWAKARLDAFALSNPRAAKA